MTIINSILAEKYDPQTQMSIGQASVIGSVIRASGPRANVLVFGCGNDSVLWHDINSEGCTLFVEDHEGWAEEVQRRNTSLRIEVISYEGCKVSSSLPIDTEKLRQFEPPNFLTQRRWDVILIDGPAGFSKQSPGRSLPIYWSSILASTETHVFVDDYDRPLEREYADFFLPRSKRPWSTVIQRVRRIGKPSAGRMFWSIGVPDMAKRGRA